MLTALDRQSGRRSASALGRCVAGVPAKQCLAATGAASGAIVQPVLRATNDCAARRLIQIRELQELPDDQHWVKGVEEGLDDIGREGARRDHGGFNQGGDRVRRRRRCVGGESQVAIRDRLECWTDAGPRGLAPAGRPCSSRVDRAFGR